MKKVHQVLTAISQLIKTIETDYPELYQFLDENPVTIPSEKHPDLDKDTLEGYLADLNSLLEHHIKNHTKAK
ncbi:hypothetical protein [Cellulophaga baltica]|uniref:hypothetical protein n=1 Tax=Cellulophaga baltica TaxID=76594 RepID=UPI00040FCEA3|nr:hypothetical protein [Cellulophaga baltica]AIY13850.1 hypothetical protein M667_11855 [Cellulophaga baltica NN016038]